MKRFGISIGSVRVQLLPGVVLSLLPVAAMACPGCTEPGVWATHTHLSFFYYFLGVWVTGFLLLWHWLERKAPVRWLRITTTIILLPSCVPGPFGILLGLPTLFVLERRNRSLQHPAQPSIGAGWAVLIIVALIASGRLLMLLLAHLVPEARGMLPAGAAILFLATYFLWSRYWEQAAWRVAVLALVLASPCLSLPIASLNSAAWWERSEHTPGPAAKALEQFLETVPWALWVPCGIALLLLPWAKRMQIRLPTGLLLGSALLLNPWVVTQFTGDVRLARAAFEGDLDAVRHLTKGGKDVDQRCRGGATPLFLAAFQGHTNITAFLLQHGANPCAATPEGLTPLHAAARNLRAEVLRQMFATGVRDDVHDQHGVTLLMTACGADDRGVITPLKAALKYGRGRGYRGNADGRMEVVDLLLARTPAINTQDAEGRTALMHLLMLDDFMAARTDQEEIVRRLLMHGADPSKKDSGGKRAVDYLTEAQTNLLALLQSAKEQ